MILLRRQEKYIRLKIELNVKDGKSIVIIEKKSWIRSKAEANTENKLLHYLIRGGKSKLFQVE